MPLQWLMGTHTSQHDYNWRPCTGTNQAECEGTLVSGNCHMCNADPAIGQPDVTIGPLCQLLRTCALAKPWE